MSCGISEYLRGYFVVFFVWIWILSSGRRTFCVFWGSVVRDFVGYSIFRCEFEGFVFWVTRERRSGVDCRWILLVIVRLVCYTVALLCDLNLDIDL